MSPMDIVADGDHPVSTKKDGGLQWWQILLGAIALLFIIWLLIKFLPLIVYTIGKVIVLPFKAIGAVNKRRKERKRQKEDAEYMQDAYDNAWSPYDEMFDDFEDFDDWW